MWHIIFIAYGKIDQVDDKVKLNLLNVINNDRIASQMDKFENIAIDGSNENEMTKYTSRLTKIQSREGVTWSTLDPEIVDNFQKLSNEKLDIEKINIHQNKEILITDWLANSPGIPSIKYTSKDKNIMNHELPDKDTREHSSRKTPQYSANIPRPTKATINKNECNLRKPKKYTKSKAHQSSAFKSNLRSQAEHSKKWLKDRLEINHSSSLEPKTKSKALESFVGNKITKYLAINITGTRKPKINTRKSTSPGFSDFYDSNIQMPNIEIIKKGYSPRKESLLKYVNFNHTDSKNSKFYCFMKF